MDDLEELPADIPSEVESEHPPQAPTEPSTPTGEATTAPSDTPSPPPSGDEPAAAAADSSQSLGEDMATISSTVHPVRVKWQIYQFDIVEATNLVAYFDKYGFDCVFNAIIYYHYTRTVNDSNFHYIC